MFVSLGRFPVTSCPVDTSESENIFFQCLGNLLLLAQEQVSLLENVPALVATQTFGFTLSFIPGD